MVSALVTSPKLQERIFSGEAIEIRMALKSLSDCGLLEEIERLHRPSFVFCGDLPILTTLF